VIAVADTPGLLAVFNRADPEHEAAKASADSCGLLIVSPLTITELHQVASARADRRTADAILATIATRALTTRVSIPQLTARLLRATLAVRRRYAELDLDLADAAVVVMAAEHRTDTVLTLDRRDFRALRPLTDHDAFRLLPDDR